MVECAALGQEAVLGLLVVLELFEGGLEENLDSLDKRFVHESVYLRIFVLELLLVPFEPSTLLCVCV